MRGCEVYHQYGDVCGVHAGNAPRLPEVFRADLGELLPRFQAQALDLRIVDVGRQALVFQLFRLFDLFKPAF